MNNLPVLFEYVKRARGLPLRVILIKAKRVIVRRLHVRVRRKRDQRHSTYSVGIGPGPYRYIQCGISPDTVRDPEHLRGIVSEVMAHRFDLLGSGWVQVQYNMVCRGVEGHRFQFPVRPGPDADGDWLSKRLNAANVASAQAIWRTISGSYTPIDWHLDFKSGYRWPETLWAPDVRFIGVEGADIKVPWELARMQHLSWLALAFTLTPGHAGFAEPGAYVREFQDQICDFIATNPPRFGINWSSTMDVGIRVANWLIAYDMFRAAGAIFDTEFERILWNSVYDHGRHIVNTLEWNDVLRGNHYLAHVVGLLFVAAYLPCTDETNVWLALAVQELVSEEQLEFFEDGSNFEGSTNYHRLSAEMVVYATTLVLGLPEDKRRALATYDLSLVTEWPAHGVPPLVPAPIPLYTVAAGASATPFPKSYIDRLERIGEFTYHVTKPDGTVPQIGDNDSGRFSKLAVSHEPLRVADVKASWANLDGYDTLTDDMVYWDERHLVHDHLIRAVGILFEGPGLIAAELTPEAMALNGIAGGHRFSSYRPAGEPTRAEQYRRVDMSVEEWFDAQISKPETIEYMLAFQGESLRAGLQTLGYPDFGLYLYRSTRLYMAIRCGVIGQLGHGGHAHNDQLHVELTVDGVDVTRDPGTYLYTPAPQQRNAYRSVSAHCVPRRGTDEPASLQLHPFQLGNTMHAECLLFTERCFAGRHIGYGKPIYRAVRVLDHAIQIVDIGVDPQYVESRSGDNSQRNMIMPDRSMPWSPGYGIRAR